MAGSLAIQPDELDRRPPSAPSDAGRADGRAEMDRHANGERVADRGRDDQRADEIGAAALVLLRPAARRARTSRSRRAPRRGRPRARRRAARSRRRGEEPARPAPAPPGSAAASPARRGQRRTRRSSTPRHAAARTAAAPRGSARRTCGRRAKTSASLAGPRRIGFVISDELKPLALRHDLQLAARESTSHPHDVGPWTSTPFGSAIPPSTYLLARHAISTLSDRTWVTPPGRAPAPPRQPPRSRLERPRSLAFDPSVTDRLAVE